MMSPIDLTAGVDNFVIDKSWLGGGAVIGLMIKLCVRYMCLLLTVFGTFILY